MSITAQWFRLRVTAVKNLGASGGSFGIFQASELVWYLAGSRVLWPGSSTATDVTGADGGSWNAGGDEGSTKLRDDMITGKGLYFFGSSGPATAPAESILTAGSAITVDEMAWGTANDAEERDPASWTLDYSTTSDTGPWTNAVTVTGATITSSRDVISAHFALGGGGGIDAVAVDTNTPTDSAVSITARLSVGTDTNTPTDSAVSITDRPVVAADTNTPSDSAVSITARLSVATDTNTPSDSAEAVTGVPAEATDTNTPTDSATSFTARIATAADTSTPTDSAVSTTTRLSTGSDTNTPSDTAVAITQQIAAATDSNTPTDSAVAIFAPSGVAFASDINTPSDSAISITQRSAMAEDFNTPSDSAICIGPSDNNIYTYIEGTAVAQDGRMVTQYLGIADPLPGGTHYVSGFAHDDQGRRYVTTWPSSPAYMAGMAIREDGVQVIAPDEVPVRAVDGIPITQQGETTVSENPPARFIGGFGLDAQGRLTVTDKGP